MEGHDGNLWRCTDTEWHESAKADVDVELLRVLGVESVAALEEQSAWPESKDGELHGVGMTA